MPDPPGPSGHGGGRGGLRSGGSDRSEGSQAVAVVAAAATDRPDQIHTTPSSLAADITASLPPCCSRAPDTRCWCWSDVRRWVVPRSPDRRSRASACASRATRISSACSQRSCCVRLASASSCAPGGCRRTRPTVTPGCSSSRTASPSEEWRRFYAMIGRVAERVFPTLTQPLVGREPVPPPGRR